MWTNMPVTAQTAGSGILCIAHIAGKNRQRPKRVEHGWVQCVPSHILALRVLTRKLGNHGIFLGFRVL